MPPGIVVPFGIPVGANLITTGWAVLDWWILSACPLACPDSHVLLKEKVVRECMVSPLRQYTKLSQIINIKAGLFGATQGGNVSFISQEEVREVLFMGWDRCFLKGKGSE